MMMNIYNQLLIMSIVAGGLYLVLKLLSILTPKYFTAVWHYYSNLIIYSFLLVPYYKIISLFHRNMGLSLPLSQPPVMAPASNDVVNLAVFFDFVPYILIAGTMIFIAVILLQGYRLKRRIFTVCYLTAEEQTLGVLFKCKQKMGIAREIPVYITPYINTPFVYGNFKPRIVLPDIKFTSEELWYVFLHELTHWKRHHLWFKGLMIFINALHWFNPLAYLARHDIDRFCELSCDESVTKSMNSQEKRKYCELILSILSNVADQKTRLSSVYAFSNKCKYLERRISMIMEKESFKNKKWVLVAAITLTLLVVSVGTTASYAASENSVIANMIPDTTPDTIETVANDGGNGRFKAIANEKQLETLNRLYNTDISFGELVEAAYPEAMEYIPAQALQNMYKTKVIWPNQDTPSSTESTTI
jgi:beta-lactamase regulating signal transducer with metallopeptidase domain